MIRIRQIKLPVEKSEKKYIEQKICKLLHLQEKDVESINIIKKSLDARKKNDLHYVFSADVKIKNEKAALKYFNDDIFYTPKEEYEFPMSGTEKIPHKPLIIGAGPAGLFCAYILAENNYKPIIIERGERVEKRVESIERFWAGESLNLESNVQFGEGGAGTFSDGKLNTLVKDKMFRGKKVFEIFVENGAPKEIMYEQHPHIGTDILRKVIINMRNKIISMGGKFYYNTKLTSININNNKLESIVLNGKKIVPCNLLVLAIGHSARDTFEMLYDKKITMIAKPFAVGLRIVHDQELINRNQYGEKYSKILPPANYKLTYNTKDKRGVYSFCMCPGGFVVNASSENKRTVVNGMSNYKRDEKTANSAIVVTITPDDFGHNPLDGVKFQRNIEQIAYQIGKGNIPLQLYGDYKNNVETTKLGNIIPNVKGKYTFANLNNIFPSYINESLKEGIDHFNSQIKGFSNDDSVLLGVESRTSSPIRIPRDEMGNSNFEGIYPCGEGAGYSGGITTSAMDGIKTAEFISKKYSK